MKSTSAYRKEYYEKNRERTLQVNREWREKNRNRDDELKREYHLKKAFGLTIAEYEEMLAAQGGVCALCKNVCPTKRRLAVDHCHVTDKVRGLLCVNCNKGIGLLKDDPCLLRLAAKYLEQAVTKST